jgi:transcriptional antiterminator Rof (Rho-off)
MYGYRIRLELVSGQGPGEPLEGSALNTETSTDKKEYLLLSTDQGVRKIELNRIKTMRAITPNPYFDLIRF